MREPLPAVLWVVGPPGVGKTSALRYLIDPFMPLLVPTPKWTLAQPVALVGHYTGQMFDGGDTLPFNGARKALEWGQRNLIHDSSLYRLVVLDGDRCSNGPSLEFVKTWGVPYGVIHLTVSPEVLAQRTAGRGSQQNATWALGRVTKAANFAVNLFAPEQRVSIDTNEKIAIHVAYDIAVAVKTLFGVEVPVHVP